MINNMTILGHINSLFFFLYSEVHGGTNWIQ